MAISSKLVGRITRTTASQTHTASGIRAHENGGFSQRSFGDRRSTASINDRTVAGYGNSMIAQGGNKRQSALTSEQLHQVRQLQQEDPHMSYARASEIVRGEREYTPNPRADRFGRRQEYNANADRGGFRDRMTTSGNRFEAGRISRGNFGQTNSVNGSTRPRLSGAANATARPAPTPTFRRPF